MNLTIDIEALRVQRAALSRAMASATEPDAGHLDDLARAIDEYVDMDRLPALVLVNLTSWADTLAGVYEPRVLGCSSCGARFGDPAYPWKAQGHATIDRDIWIEDGGIEIGEFDWYDTIEEVTECPACGLVHEIPSEDDIAKLRS